MSEIAIRAESLSKRYRIGHRQEVHNSLAGAIGDFATRPVKNLRKLRRLSTFRDGDESEDTIWALKDVSFEVKEGEVIGLIGKNGSGKSTLLKVLSRITRPTRGRALVWGRVSSLLEVGTGFHQELTGRDNTYLNGTVLGMSRKEIARKFDEIVDFSGVESFIDTPVKRYSSGMQVRLAFSVAAHLEPEILLVDEVLAVGDVAFQKKCMGKMGAAASDGRTVVFVSHNMAAVQRLCPKAILLRDGEIADIGDTNGVITAYLSDGGTSGKGEDLRSRSDRKGNGIIRFESVTFHRANGEKASVFLSGDQLQIRLRYTMYQEPSAGSRVLVAMGFQNQYGDTLFSCSNDLTGEIEGRWPASGQITCLIPELPLVSGVYDINLYLAINGVVADWVTDAAVFQVETGDYYRTGRLPPPSHGRFLIRHAWSIQEQ